MSDRATRLRRLGWVLAVPALLGLLSLVPAFLEGGAIIVATLLILMLAAMIVSGLGLVRGWRFARVTSGILVALAAVGALVSFLQGWWRVVPYLTWTLAENLAVANAVAALALWLALCVRALRLLADREPASSTATLRVVGASLLVVAVYHLQLVLEHGTDLMGTVRLTFSLDGIFLLGFPGWHLWHAALLAIAGGFLIGRRRVAAVAALALVVLFVVLVPLGLIAMSALPFGFDAGTLIVAVVPLFEAYLAWWCWDELRTTATSGQSPASAPSSTGH